MENVQYTYVDYVNLVRTEVPQQPIDPTERLDHICVAVEVRLANLFAGVSMDEGQRPRPRCLGTGGDAFQGKGGQCRIMQERAPIYGFAAHRPTSLPEWCAGTSRDDQPSGLHS